MIIRAAASVSIAICIVIGISRFSCFYNLKIAKSITRLHFDAFGASSYLYILKQAYIKAAVIIDIL